MKRLILAVAALAAATGGLLWTSAGGAADEAPDAAVERTRKQVRMLDDLYKTAIVLITEHYVVDDTVMPAGEAFQALFAAMEEKGWHEVRLLDATGEPIVEDNAPREGFEQQAVAAVLAGESYIDEVTETDGKRYLHAATPVPVVMKRCIMCHAHYADVPEGQAIGALAYTVPIE